MDPLGYPLTTYPIQTDWGFTIKLYSRWQFRYSDDPDSQLANSSVGTWTWTWCASRERFLRLLTTRPIQTGSEMSIQPYFDWYFGYSTHPNDWFANNSTLTQTPTPSCSPELLRTPLIPASTWCPSIQLPLITIVTIWLVWHLVVPSKMSPYIPLVLIMGITLPPLITQLLPWCPSGVRHLCGGWVCSVKHDRHRVNRWLYFSASILAITQQSSSLRQSGQSLNKVLFNNSPLAPYDRYKAIPSVFSIAVLSRLADSEPTCRLPPSGVSTYSSYSLGKLNESQL